MWFFSLLIPSMFGIIFIRIFSSRFINNIKDKKKKDRIIKNIKRITISLIALIITTSAIFQFGGFRFDYASGQHIIIPTAMDTDFWGNYKIYYKTTIYETNQSESYYMIEKERTDLVEQIRDFLKDRKQIMVYYDRWVGFKGMSSPDTAPIIKIEEFN